jgi:carbon-monoxide dehydrogenase small subunit
MNDEQMEIRLTLNGAEVHLSAEPRETLADALRRTQGTRSVRLGCEHGACGACTVLVDGRTARSCLLFAVQASGLDVRTAEGLAVQGEAFGDLADRLAKHNAFQCGFCATGMLLSAGELLAEGGEPDEAEVRDRLAGNLCRCTGYQRLVDTVLNAAADGCVASTKTPTEEAQR